MALYLFVGEKLQKFTKNNAYINLSVAFLPSWLIVQFYQEGFVAALKYAGAFLSIFALIAPAACVWKLRLKQDSASYQAPGGRFGLVLIILIGFAFVVLGV